jgi:hypothetical protein
MCDDAVDHAFVLFGLILADDGTPQLIIILGSCGGVCVFAAWTV